MSTKLLETLIDAGLLSDNGKSAADMMFLSWCVVVVVVMVVVTPDMTLWPCSAH